MSENDKKKVHFISLGCPKNLVDTEIMLGSLSRDGYQVTDQPETADTIIVNTCGFIEDAKKESVDKVLEMAKLKGSGSLKKLVVAGCLTQRYKDDLVEGIPEADLFLGSGHFQQVSELLGKSYAGSSEKKFFDQPTFLQQEGTPRINSEMQHRAYLKISEGCKKRCAFCAIPLIRGNLQSRKVDDVVNEAKLLVASGVKELIIVSHDFTDYGWDIRRKDKAVKDDSFELLKRLSDESGAQWIRVLYLYPDGISEELVDLIANRNNLAPYFDMPLQHISNPILKLMNRRMTREEIESAVKMIRQKIPDAVIRTQFIVGFPGENEEDFNQLVDFIEAYEFDRVGCFVYSDEEGTKAASLPDSVPFELRQKRHDRLMEVQKEISRDKQSAQVGKILPVLVEGYSEETDLLLRGRHINQAPDIDGLTYISSGKANVGDIVEVEIIDSHDYDLVGQMLTTS